MATDRPPNAEPLRDMSFFPRWSQAFPSLGLHSNRSANDRLAKQAFAIIENRRPLCHGVRGLEKNADSNQQLFHFTDRLLQTHHNGPRNNAVADVQLVHAFQGGDGTDVAIG